MYTRIKICGITNLKDALYAIEQGADALGFVFYPPSPRYISSEDAANIMAQLPPFVSSVGLFVDATEDIISTHIETTQLDLLQFHGKETPIFCQQFSRPYIKAIRVKETADITQAIDQYSSSQALLLDTYKKGIPGGTGESFNWDLIPKQNQKAIILAGGLNTENISKAIEIVKPYAVDVSGGVEESHGIKSRHKVKEFIAATKTK